MGDDDRGLSDDEIADLQDILETNREAGANQHTMGIDEEDED
ncbi:hypothetical protein [Natrinema pallidum]|nr:hypothetical protein [Natrinema pallidum]